jgi:AcrR family transcriptional regulator
MTGRLLPGARVGSNGAVTDADRPRSTARASGEDTRTRLVAAALGTVREAGIAGVSARAIARTGGFNQALIFYHFGSVDGLLVAASRAESERRAALYERELAAVATLPDLVRVARRLHEEETAHGNVAVLTQMLAGAATSAELRAGVREGFEPWLTVVETAVARVIGATPFADVIDPADLTYAISALYLGVELLATLEDDDARSHGLLDALDSVSGLVQVLLGGGTPPGP